MIGEGGKDLRQGGGYWELASALPFLFLLWYRMLTLLVVQPLCCAHRWWPLGKGRVHLASCFQTQSGWNGSSWWLIWPDLELTTGKLLYTFVKDFPDQIPWSWKTHPKCGQRWDVPSGGSLDKGNARFFFALLAFNLTGEFNSHTAAAAFLWRY